MTTGMANVAYSQEMHLAILYFKGIIIHITA